MSNHLPNTGAKRAPLQKVVTRHNGLLFHSTAIASFLESTAPLHANALAALPGMAPAARRWLEDEWSPATAARGRRLRAYVEATWGEFDWPCAYAEYYEAYRPRAVCGYAGRQPAATMLALCATAAQVAAFYRGLAAYADDPELRELLRDASGQEAHNFDSLRVLYERFDRTEPLRAFESYRTVVRAAQHARDGAVRLAFEHVACGWCERAPFPQMSYALFLERITRVLERLLVLDVVQRALFRPWMKAPSAPALEPPRSRRDGAASTAAPGLAIAA